MKIGLRRIGIIPPYIPISNAAALISWCYWTAGMIKRGQT